MLRSFTVILILLTSACANQKPAITVEKITNQKEDTGTIQSSSTFEEKDQEEREADHSNSKPAESGDPGESHPRSPSHASLAEGWDGSSRAWTMLSNQDGIKTYAESHPAGEIVSFRGEAVLRTSIEKLTAVLNTPELRKEWVDALAETHTIEKKNTLDRIEYVRSKVPWPFQDRDFVFRVQVQVRESPYSILVQMNSVDDPREPPHSGVVRGSIQHAYYFLKDVSTPQAPATEVIVEIAADPKGSIPSWIVNLTQRSWPNHTLRALEKVASRDDLIIAPEINQFFRKSSNSHPGYTTQVSRLRLGF